ncbi:hypothetical protein [Actinoplanes awajinensis]|nr:hypothetical protein [Actinoplanes awajinensis]
MSSRLISAALAGIVVTLMACAGGLAMVGGAAVSSACTTPSAGTDFDAGQRASAALIAQVGADRGIPVRGQIIAVATALQESGLRNLNSGDRDSVGLFQQRPSQGWGSRSQLRNPTYAAGRFYAKLTTVPGWQAMPLTRAAQAVQRSAYPDAYAKWENAATALVYQRTASSNAASVRGASNSAASVRAASSGAAPVCPDLALGVAEPAPRNADSSWPAERCSIRPDPTTGAGCITPRLQHLVQQTTAAGFPKPSCYRPANHGEHPLGRACDWMMTSGGAALGPEKAHGDAMAAWAVTNADRLGIAYVIWYRTIWTKAQGWHAYTNPWGANDPSGWHTNHVHISVQ